MRGKARERDDEREGGQFVRQGRWRRVVGVAGQIHRKCKGKGRNERISLAWSLSPSYNANNTSGRTVK
jgi:hypothetical protein